MSQELISMLKTRFEKNMKRHSHVSWKEVQSKIEIDSELQETILQLESTGGEPDIVVFDESTDEIYFVDCSAESPTERRSLCYDRQSWESRKSARPDNNAVDVAKEIGIEMLTEEEYRKLQELGEFDLKTSSWIKTPVKVRSLGGALFMDRRFDTVFVYHNGAESYYAARGFRGKVRI